MNKTMSQISKKMGVIENHSQIPFTRNT